MERVSYGQLSLRERIEIYRLHEDGKSARFIAKALGRSPSTISRELRRNSQPSKKWQGGYDPQRAQSLYMRRHARGCKHKLERQPELRKKVFDLLAMEQSPEQIAGRLNRVEGKQVISHESIYRYIYWHSYVYRSHEWHKMLPLQRRTRRLNGRRKNGTAANNIPNRRPLCERPAGAVNRSRFGHWEGDLMQFSEKGRAVLVVHDRRSRYVCLSWLETKTAQDVIEGLHQKFANLPENKRKTITFDNGQEFRLHQQLTQKYGMQTFFCEPRAPWQKGGVENSILRLRRFLPRKADVKNMQHEDLEKIAHKVNNTPRKCLGFKTPSEVFFKSTVALRT